MSSPSALACPPDNLQQCIDRRRILQLRCEQMAVWSLATVDPGWILYSALECTGVQYSTVQFCTVVRMISRGRSTMTPPAPFCSHEMCRHEEDAELSIVVWSSVIGSQSRAADGRLRAVSPPPCRNVRQSARGRHPCAKTLMWSLAG